MDMKISVTSQEGFSRPLRLEVFGLCFELSGITGSSLLAVSEGPGGVTVSLTGQQEAQQPIADAEQETALDAEPVYPEEITDSDIAAGDSEVAGRETADDSADQQTRLFQELAALRRRISSEINLPPYIIFHDRTLKEMCRLLPSDLESLGSVQGVGKAKLDKYGELFLAVIREHTKAA